MDKKAKYYKAMNFEFEVALNSKEKPKAGELWNRFDAITNVAIFDADISGVKEYMKLVHHKERLTHKYIDLLIRLPR